MLRIVSALALVLVGTAVCQAADTGDVKRWIAALDDDRYAAREDATNHLINAGYAPAIKHVIRTAESGSLEARMRALHILSVWHGMNDASKQAVNAAATRWQKTDDPQLTRLSKELVAKTTPQPARPSVPDGMWDTVIIGGVPMAVPATGARFR